MTRHRQKDEEAGAEGYGILNTRKVSFRVNADTRRLTVGVTTAHVERSRRQNRHKETDTA